MQKGKYKRELLNMSKEVYKSVCVIDARTAINVISERQLCLYSGGLGNDVLTKQIVKAGRCIQARLYPKTDRQTESEGVISITWDQVCVLSYSVKNNGKNMALF